MGRPKKLKEFDPRKIDKKSFYPEAGLPGGYEEWKRQRLPFSKARGSIEEEMMWASKRAKSDKSKKKKP